MVRFAWKRDIGKKAKIMVPIYPRLFRFARADYMRRNLVT